MSVCYNTHGFRKADLKTKLNNSQAPFRSREKRAKFTFIDLFAGIGGIRLPYQELGGRCVFSSEWDERAAATYEANFGEKPHGDITKIDPKSIPDFDVLLGGFPCQPFSIIGDKEGFGHETQGTLFFTIEKILLEKRPKAFMLENVRNLTAHDNGRTFKVIVSHLEKAGYDVHAKVLNALDYGCAQKRERIIICGFREAVSFGFPPPVPIEQRATVADIIDESAANDRSLFVRPAIRASRLKRLKDKRFPKPYISCENIAGAVTPHNYSSALRADASANYILINDERRPSPRELLRIQGFPDEFRVVGNYSQIRHQIGNSVAVPVIRAVARRVVAALKDVTGDCHASDVRYRSGQIAKVVFRELASRQLIGRQELAYLQSPNATADFGTHGFPVLREYVEDAPGLALDKNGARRYYSSYTLKIGRKDYMLCSQFKPEKKEHLLEWAQSLGLNRSEILELCDSQIKRRVPRTNQPTHTSEQDLLLEYQKFQMWTDIARWCKSAGEKQLLKKITVEIERQKARTKHLANSYFSERETVDACVDGRRNRV